MPSRPSSSRPSRPRPPCRPRPADAVAHGHAASPRSRPSLADGAATPPRRTRRRRPPRPSRPSPAPTSAGPDARRHRPRSRRRSAERQRLASAIQRRRPTGIGQPRRRATLDKGGQGQAGKGTTTPSAAPGLAGRPDRHHPGAERHRLAGARRRHGVAAAVGSPATDAPASSQPSASAAVHHAATGERPALGLTRTVRPGRGPRRRPRRRRRAPRRRSRGRSPS